MGELHLRIHLSKQLLSDGNTSIHLHVEDEGVAAAPGKARVLGQVTGSSGGSGSSGGCGSSQLEPAALTAEQRIRPKFYELQFVPESEQTRSQRSDKQDRYEALRGETIKFELSSGNQRNPIIWESFAPHATRGQWRFTVRRDFSRMIGVLTFERDSSAMWVVSEWTPAGSLILDSIRPGVDPKIMLVPITF